MARFRRLQLSACWLLLQTVALFCSRCDSRSNRPLMMITRRRFAASNPAMAPRPTARRRRTTKRSRSATSPTRTLPTCWLVCSRSTTFACGPASAVGRTFPTPSNYPAATKSKLTMESCVMRNKIKRPGHVGIGSWLLILERKASPISDQRLH